MATLRERSRSQGRSKNGASLLTPGSKVWLHGLKSAADLNGQQAILDSFVDSTGRWRVKLNSGLLKDLKPENLKPLEDVQAKEPDPKDTAGNVSGSFGGKPGEACGPKGRFIIQEKLGEGTFATVYRCKDAEMKGAEYAIKFTKGSEKLRTALEREVKLMGYIAKDVASKDPEGTGCLLRLAFYQGFEVAGRFAVVFELMKYDLRAALSKYGKGKGLPLLPTVRNFGRNLFCALRALRVAALVHCDVKPENLLMSRDNETVKLCDFGAALGTERPKTDQLQPRHYRAPEVILGQDYGAPIDMWSAGATLFELATDVILFKGQDNNEVLHAMLKTCGAQPKKFVRSGKYGKKHFDEAGDFQCAEAEWSNVPMASFIQLQRPIQNLLQERLKEPPKGVQANRFEGLVSHLVDLLGKVLVPDQTGRETPDGALGHRFFQKGA